MNFNDKKVLFMSPSSFNYEIEIIKEMRALGAQVDYIDDRPLNSSFSKILSRIFPRVGLLLSYQFYKRLFSKVNVDYDVIICVKLELVSKALLESFFATQFKAIKIYYSWDSFSNSKNSILLLNLFDRKYSFDSVDCKKYNIEHKPLFYIDKFTVPSALPNFTFDISFVGSIHYKRYIALKSIFNNQSPFSFFSYMYVPSKSLYWLRKIFLFPIFGKSRKSDFNFISLPSNEVVDIFKQSRCVFDFAHHNQVGLTMRTIETHGARKKLITNNINILDYDFYHPNNILILDGNYKDVNEFLSLPYFEVDEELYKKYSLQKWLLTI